jgi:hypothetical protein
LLAEPQQITLEDVKHAFLLGTSKMDDFIKHFWEMEFMEPSTMTAKQKACEEHPHTQPNREGRSCGQTSNQDGIHSTWNISPLCRARTTNN